MASENYRIGKSQIQGVGVIARRPFHEGDIIGIGLVYTIHGFMATENFGRYINHSYTPNSELLKKDKVYNLVASQDIAAGEEITVNYNDAPDCVERAKPEYV